MCCVAAQPLYANEPAFHAGVARVCITPETNMWMSGYRKRDRPADGKVHDLWAKALIIRDSQSNQVLLITADIVGIDRQFSVDVCHRLSKQYQLKRNQIAICVSHTHSGPVVGDCLAPQRHLNESQQQLVDGYEADLKKKIVELVGKAIAQIAPSQLSWGNGICDFAVNRRENPESKVPQLRMARQLKGPIDHSVPVLKVVEAESQRIRAIVFGYACHATVTSLYEWSGDYPGFAQLAVEDQYPDAIAMFWAGCGADQNPLPRRTIKLAQLYGKKLSESVKQVLDDEMMPIHGNLTSSYKEIPLPMQKLPTREDLKKAFASEDALTANWARVVLERMQRGGGLSDSYPYPVQVWQLGNGPRFVLLGGEVVVDYSLRLKLELSKRTWVAGYANDVMNYIPSRRVWSEGGYEGSTSMFVYGRPARWTPNIERAIVAEVLRQAR